MINMQPSNCSLGAFIPEKWKFVYTKTCAPLFIAALFLMAPKLETTQMFFSGWMVKQTLYIHTMNYCSEIRRNKLLKHTTTSMNLLCIILGEKSQSPKVTYYIIPFIKHFLNNRICKNGEQISGCQGLGMGREMRERWMWF